MKVCLLKCIWEAEAQEQRAACCGQGCGARGCGCGTVGAGSARAPGDAEGPGWAVPSPGELSTALLCAASPAGAGCTPVCGISRADVRSSRCGTAAWLAP